MIVKLLLKIAEHRAETMGGWREIGEFHNLFSSKNE
jgi:hypothetical protein